MARVKKTYSYRSRPRVPANRSRAHLYHRTQPSSPVRMPAVPLRPLLVVLAVILVVWALFLSPFFRVTQVSVTGLKTVPKDLVLEKVSQTVAGGSTLFLPRDSQWLYPAGQISSELKQAFPSFTKVKVSRHFLHGVTIAVVEQPVSLVWQSADQQYLVGENGVVTGHLPPGYRAKLVITDTAKLPVSVGKQILSPSFIDFMQTVYEQLPGTVHTKVATVTVAETTLEATVVTAAGYSIFFDTTRSPEKQLGYLKEIVDQVTAQHQALDYIDLRVDDRIFYKLK